MKQIAKDLNLNRVTVSLVMNGHARVRGVSEQTEARVNEYLKKVGYVASRGAIALRTGKRAGVGILHSGHLYTHLTQAFNALTNTFSESPNGLEIVVRPSAAILDGLREMVSRGVERIIWVHGGGVAISPENREEVLALAGQLRTVIYNFRFDRKDEDKELLAHGFSLVGMNRRSGYSQMARFVKGLGHHRILLGDAHEDTPLSLDGLLLEVMQSHGLDATLTPPLASPSPVLFERSVELGRKIARSVIEKHFSLVCFRDDEVAGIVTAEMMSRGIRVPEDVAVISMDGHPLSGIFQVPLTTFAVPVNPMVAKTIELIQEDEKPGAFTFPYKLIRRKSHQQIQ